MRVELKQFLADHDLTQTQAASIFGVKQSAWNYWQNDTRDMPPYFEKMWSFFHRMSKREQQKEIQAAKDNKALLPTAKDAEQK